MKKNVLLSLLVLPLLILAASCKPKEAPKNESTCVEKENVTEIQSDKILTSAILTQEQQAQLSPDAVFDMLKKGNNDFINDNLTVRNNTQRIREASLGQFPKVAIVSCLDSRVPVEDVFHLGIGDAFVGRIAGNTVNEDMLGSLEFACKVSGAKIIVVLGHEHCGAVVSAIDNVKLGNITVMLARIRPAVAMADKSFKGDNKSSNPAFVEAVCKENVKHAISEIRTKSPILKEMETKGEIKVVGGVYNMGTGKVDFL